MWYIWDITYFQTFYPALPTGRIQVYRESGPKMEPVQITGRPSRSPGHHKKKTRAKVRGNFIHGFQDLHFTQVVTQLQTTVHEGEAMIRCECSAPFFFLTDQNTKRWKMVRQKRWTSLCMIILEKKGDGNSKKSLKHEYEWVSFQPSNIYLYRFA